MKLSVVIPVYGCRAALPELHRRLVKTLSTITSEYEIVLVEDHCPQNSWQEIERICAMDSHVTGIKMSRNFGQMRAIIAGLDYCTGDWVIVMDCDLQDKPEAIIELYAKCQEGYDVVFVRRKDRKDNTIVKFLSQLFYKAYNYFTDGTYDSSLSHFSIASRKVIDVYCKMREQNRSYAMFLKWLGFPQAEIEVEGDKRFEGKSSYNFRRKVNLALQIITSQSNKPLLLSVKVGFLIAALSLVYLVITVFRYFFAGPITIGWTSMIVSIYLMGGLILAAIGILGIYIGNIFNESKKRPLYVVERILNKEIDE